MPAYFNLSLQFERKSLYSDFVKDFFEALERGDAVFVWLLGGGWIVIIYK